MNISEVSKKFNFSTDTLRYYERIGLIPPVHRTASGIRDYQENDLEWIDFIKCMRGAGLPIEVLIEYIRLFQQGDATVKARMELLLEQRQILATKIKTMQETLGRLDHKIEGYNGQLVKVERKLTQYSK